MNTRARGFTLLELMIAIAIVAILLAVALPSYNAQRIRAQRQEAKAMLLKIAQLQERWYTVNSTYTANIPVLLGLAGGATVYSGENPADNNGKYIINQAAAGGACPLTSCFVLSAVPNAPFADAECGTLGLSSTGVRTSTGSLTTQQCWAR